MYIYICVCMYVCMYVYIYIHMCVSKSYLIYDIDYCISSGSSFGAFPLTIPDEGDQARGFACN